MMDNETNFHDSSELHDDLELYRSRLNNLQSEPLTEGYGMTRTPEYQDSITFFEDEIDAIEEELEFLEDDKFLNDFFNMKKH